MRTISAMTLMGLAALGTAAGAQQITVTIENTMAADSFFFTPVWIAAHDGSFDVYDGGTFASGWPGLTEIAEGGDTSVLSSHFMSLQPDGRDATVTAVAFDGDAPVFSPGESTSYVLGVGDASVNRYFSFASMVIPSNDLFFGNGDPTAHELFDGSGDFNGPIVIEIYGRDVNDNGTEVNDAFGGAAFSANGGADQDEMELIRDFFTDPGDEAYLASFIGSMTGNGATIGSAFAADELIARITIVPTPGTAAVLGLAGLAGVRRRR